MSFLVSASDALIPKVSRES